MNVNSSINTDCQKGVCVCLQRLPALCNLIGSILSLTSQILINTMFFACNACWPMQLNGPLLTLTRVRAYLFGFYVIAIHESVGESYLALVKIELIIFFTDEFHFHFPFYFRCQLIVPM